MDSVRSGPFGQIFRPDNFVFGKKQIEHFCVYASGNVNFETETSFKMVCHHGGKFLAKYMIYMSLEFYA